MVFNSIGAGWQHYGFKNLSGFGSSSAITLDPLLGLKSLPTSNEWFCARLQMAQAKEGIQDANCY